MKIPSLKSVCDFKIINGERAAMRGSQPRTCGPASAQCTGLRQFAALAVCRAGTETRCALGAARSVGKIQDTRH